MVKGFGSLHKYIIGLKLSIATMVSQKCKGYQLATLSPHSIPWNPNLIKEGNKVITYKRYKFESIFWA
jgi:hypothetical protein